MRTVPLIPTALLLFAIGASPLFAQNQTGSQALAKPGGVQAQTGSRELGRQQATAQPGSPPFFAAADTNQDGMLSPLEMRTHMPFIHDAQFAHFDTNGDGLLSPAEAAAGSRIDQPVMQSTFDTFARADINLDQRLSPEELRRVAPEFTRDNFRQWDTDNDGFVGVDEWTAASRGSIAAGMQNLSVMTADKNADGLVSFDELGALMPNVSAEEFRRVDTNRDNLLSRDELTASGAANTTIVRGTVESFNRVDSDNDGNVTFSELSAAAPQFRQEHFTEMDTNRDGSLSIDEWSKAVPGAAPNSILSDGRLARADLNNNGKFSFRELSRVATGITREEFNAADTNRDGDLSPEELQAAGIGQRINQ